MAMTKNAAERHWDAQAEAGAKSAWTQNSVVLQNIFSRVSNGTNKFWLNWLIEDLLNRKFSNVLSVGCGTGGHELIMARTGQIKHIDAFDLSGKSIEIARNNAANQGISNINYEVCDFANIGQKYGAGRYDMVCFFGSLHHVRELEQVLQTISNLLTDDGILVFNEYIGDCYTILKPRQTELINRLLSCFSPELLNPDRPSYVNPTIQHMLEFDPSEATRSSLILPFLEYYFSFEHLIPFGGEILHMLYPSLSHGKLNDNSAESVTIMKLLTEFEKVLEEAGYVQSDFYLGVCRKKR